MNYSKDQEENLKKIEETFIENIKKNLSNIDEQSLIHGAEELNKVLLHISNLIQDSYTLYNKDSYNTSVCLSILAMEEISKANIGIFQALSYTEESKSKKNYLLKNHKNKDILSTSPTINIGKRLKNKIGIDKLLAIMNDLQNGNMIKLRENSIYYFRENDKLYVPKEIISKEKARNLLLYVIEQFDDTLIGFTNFSYELEQKHNTIFDKIK